MIGLFGETETGELLAALVGFGDPFVAAVVLLVLLGCSGDAVMWSEVELMV